MGKKATNTNYDILDRILQESDRKERGNGFTPFQDENGQWVTSKEQFDTLYKNVSDIEKYLRS